MPLSPFPLSLEDLLRAHGFEGEVLRIMVDVCRNNAELEQRVREPLEALDRRRVEPS